MPGRLRTDALNLSEADAIASLVAGLRGMLAESDRKYRLDVSKRYYFALPEGPITDSAGWYLIRAGTEPIYVGTAENLDARLNSENGSRDQFANPKRTSDSERNFIKAFSEAGVLTDLSVTVLPEEDLCAAIGIDCPLTKRDRHNVEKVLNIFKTRVTDGNR